LETGGPGAGFALAHGKSGLQFYSARLLWIRLFGMQLVHFEEHQDCYRWRTCFSNEHLRIDQQPDLRNLGNMPSAITPCPFVYSPTKIQRYQHRPLISLSHGPISRGWTELSVSPLLLFHCPFSFVLHSMMRVIPNINMERNEFGQGDEEMRTEDGKLCGTTGASSHITLCAFVCYSWCRRKHWQLLWVERWRIYG